MRTGSLETDYLVVGAGAMGMAFTDALIDHADVHVTLVDRRHAAGGHWQDAYPFVQLHQASLFYGVASTVLGTGALQQHGPETGLQERARRSEIQHYYDDLLFRRFVDSGRVTFLGASEYHADGSSHLVTSRVSGETTPGERASPGRRRRVPLADDSGDHTASVRRGRRRAGRRGQRARPARRRAQPLRDRRVGKDGHRRDRLAADERRGAGPDHVGASARAVDAQPRDRATRPGDRAPVGGRDDDRSGRRRVARRAVPPPRGGRRDAARRSRRRADDGEDAHPGRVGAGAAAHRRRRRPARPRRPRDCERAGARPWPGRAGAGVARGALRGVGLAEPAAGSALGSRRDPVADDPGRVSPASVPRSPATWRRPATTTASATGCAHPTHFPNDPLTWVQMQVRGTARRRVRTAPSPTSPSGPTGARSTRRASIPRARDDPVVQAAAARLAEVAEPGFTRLAELARLPLS